jgi:phosphohistidine phosphatase
MELMLLRHAKSSWDDAILDDAARPLAPRGEVAATAMGAMMAAEGLVPDRVLCSPALRARQTWERVSACLPRPVEAEIFDGLYDFGDGSALAEVVRRSGGEARRLMLVGHNPAMENLANRLAAAGDKKLRALMAEKYPTAALAVLSFDLESWRDFGAQGGTLARFVRPRDLRG